MAKTITTRIKNKVADISNWNSSSVNKVDSDIRLLDGEIAIVRVPTGDTYTNPVTDKDEPVVELLMKVGDGSTVFSQLPWLSAKASDVYDWAKTPDVKDVKVKVKKGTATAATESTLETWLKTVYDKGVDNATLISGLDTIVDKLDGADTVDGSVRKLIKAAIEDLDVSTSSGSGNFVKAVTQVDGKIQVTKGTIAESELPNISASKIIVTPASGDAATVTLDTKLGSIDTDIINLKNKQVGHTDAQINTLIDNKINDLDVSEPTASGTSTSFIATAKQEDGKIVVTKKNLPTADASTAGIITLGVKDGAATYNSIFGTDGKGGINALIETNKTDIANLKSAVAGGVHFRGTVTAKPTSANVVSPAAVAGDIVLWAAEGIEYIYTGSAWEELGDVTRLGEAETAIENLEKALDALDVAETNTVANTHKFVSQVTQTDGKIAVTYTQPTSADVSHDGGTVATKLVAHDAEVAKLSGIATGKTVGDAITTALDSLDFTSPSVPTSGTTTATEFIDTVSQENGQISATKKKLPTATTGTNGAAGTAGIVALIDSTSSTSTTAAATANAVKTAYDKADDAYTLASGKANASHTHGDITNEGTLATANAVVVTDANNKIIASTNITTTELGYLNGVTSNIQDQLNAKGTSNLVIGTTATTAAAGNHNHDNSYADKQAFANVQSNYVRFNSADSKLYVGSGTEEIIFDCGGAPV